MRRIHVPKLVPGLLVLDPAEAHHVRDVLRLTPGTSVELFDDAGVVVAAVLAACDPDAVSVQIDSLPDPSASPAPFQWTLASAVPKAARADWMIEKLAELGTTAFLPLITERSVVHPEGKNKFDRWTRIAIEAAKQCHRPSVMRILDLLPLPVALAQLAGPAWYLSTDPAAVPVAQAFQSLSNPSSLTLFIGPEGDWSDAEITLFQKHHLTPVHLTTTILRVETAAITASALTACLLAVGKE